MLIYKIKTRPKVSIEIQEPGKREVTIQTSSRIDQSFYQDEYGFDLNNFEVNLHHAHQSVWTDFLVQSGNDWCLIFEQGVKFCIDFKSIEQSLQDLPIGTELFFPFDKITARSKNEINRICCSRLGYYWGSQLYILHKNGASKLLANADISLPVDEKLLEMSLSNSISSFFSETSWYSFDEVRCKSYVERKTSLKRAVMSYPAWPKGEKKRAINMLKILSNHARCLNIDLFLHAGSLLGQVRHHQIMPWDDDIDLAMSASDIDKFIAAVKKEGILKITPWVYPKTGATYYKFWLANGVPAEGYEYTFPFIDIWLIHSEGNGQVKLTDGYVFDQSVYTSPTEVHFEGSEVCIPQNPRLVLDAMYTDWKERIRIFAWCHRTKKPSFKKLALDISVDENGLMVE